MVTYVEVDEGGYLKKIIDLDLDRDRHSHDFSEWEEVEEEYDEPQTSNN